MFADAKVEISPREALAVYVRISEIFAVFDVVLGGTVQINRTGNILRHHLSNMLKHVPPRLTSCYTLRSGILRDTHVQLLDGRGSLGSSILEVIGQVRVSSLPHSKCLAPCIVLGQVRVS